MKTTRFMDVMFSNTDEELANQVDSDIKKAAQDGEVDTEEVKYERTNDGNVAITDKENGQVTIAEKDANGTDYVLSAVPDEQLERFAHPSADGVTPGNQVGTPDEKLENHFNGSSVISPNMPCGGLNPQAGHERSVERTAEEGPTGEEKEFSISSDNVALQKIFSLPQEFADYLFSEVIESADTSKFGDLKVDKCADDDDSAIVTDISTGDQVKVTIKDGDMTVTELDSKTFSNEEQYMPLFVVGVQPYDHYIVDSLAYGEEAAAQLKAHLEEDGIDAVQVFDNQDDARDYANGLLTSLGADEVEEPVEEKTYSESIGFDVYTHAYSTDNTVFMSRCFSENDDAVSGNIAEAQDAVQEAIKSGKETELDGATITPVDPLTAVISDGDELTKAKLSDEAMELEKIDEAEAKDLIDGIGEAESEGSEEKIYSNATRFFSKGEDLTSYMERLYSEEADQDLLEAAIDAGKEIENENEIITPVDSKTAVVEDKENGEHTKVVLVDDDIMNVAPISDDEADNLVENIKVDDDSAVAIPETDEECAECEEDENEDHDGEEEEKNYSNYCFNEEQTKCFSVNEPLTDYMQRLFSDEADQDHVEAAVESGKQIETDNEVITPVDSSTAVIEDKKNGEFTKAELNDETMNVEPISEDEADELTKDLKVSKDAEQVDAEEKAPEDVEVEEKHECSKTFSGVCFNDAETKCFSVGDNLTSYMQRLFSDEADQDDIEKAIEEGKPVETASEKITPVDDKTAVIEDKENGELTKAELDGDTMDINPISKEEADKLENTQKEFSQLDKFFALTSGQIDAQAAAPAPAAPVNDAVPVQNPVQAPVAADPNAVPAVEGDAAPSVEQIEDKAIAAVQSIEAAAKEATAQIMDAKATPAPTAEPDIKEAQFSAATQKTFSQNAQEDTLVSWLQYK